MPKVRVGVVFGGRSVEHEVSIASAASIVSALDPGRYEVTLLAVDVDGRWRLGTPGALPESVSRGAEVRLPAVPGDGTLVSAEDGRPAARLDVVFPIIHGTGGEDGCVQGFLELADLPYVGAGVLGSALQMDKEVSKRLLCAAGLPVVPWIGLREAELAADPEGSARAALEQIGLPAFVKPACLGSSVGISRVTTPAELAAGLREAARYDGKILVEHAVDAREIEVGVIGIDTPEASVPGEIVPRHEFYDYESKYVDEETELVIPAALDEAQTAEARRLALAAYRTLEGEGLGRVDFLLDRASGRFFVSEVNSLPGFTEASMFPKLWQASGLAYPELLDRLIELAVERHRRRTALERTYRRG
jgi:D-alanine-D-alanine ligase